MILDDTWRTTNAQRDTWQTGCVQTCALQCAAAQPLCPPTLERPCLAFFLESARENGSFVSPLMFARQVSSPHSVAVTSAAAATRSRISIRTAPGLPAACTAHRILEGTCVRMRSNPSKAACATMDSSRHAQRKGSRAFRALQAASATAGCTCRTPDWLPMGFAAAASGALHSVAEGGDPVRYALPGFWAPELARDSRKPLAEPRSENDTSVYSSTFIRCEYAPARRSAAQCSHSDGRVELASRLRLAVGEPQASTPRTAARDGGPIRLCAGAHGWIRAQILHRQLMRRWAPEHRGYLFGRLWRQRLLCVPGGVMPLSVSGRARSAWSPFVTTLLS